MLNEVYEVWETNADLEQVKRVHLGMDQDIALSKCVKLYKAVDGKVDFFVYNLTKREMVGYMLSPRTSHLRGECQG